VFGVFFLFVAGWAAYGIYYLLRSSKRNQQYLASAKEEQPLQLEHLTGGLRQLAQDTRLLRVSLEAPIRDIADFRTGDFHQSASEDLDGFDNMLLDVSRQLGDWVRTVERLPDADRTRLEDMGLSAVPIERAIATEGGAFERRFVLRPGQPPMDQRLRNVVAELRRFEDALQVAPRVYR
jgi:hypothetical protein